LSALFISYSRLDSEVADKLIAALQQAGHNCWRDKAEVQGGDDWGEKISKAIEGCEGLVALVSDDYAESKWTRREWRYADDAGKLIIPCLLHDRKLPFGMNLLEPILLYGAYYEKGLGRLLSVLARIKRVSAALTHKQELAAELHRETTTPPRRAEIGDELAALGDSRRGVSASRDGLPDIDWIGVPAGPFIYQGVHRRVLNAFHISRYPITNAQHEEFRRAGGYSDVGWWEGLSGRAQKPEGVGPAFANRPWADATWYEAVAYCRWLSSRLGYEVRLPQEDEWERAAGGEDGRLFPWGDKYRSGWANVDEIQTNYGSWYLKRTTAVGMYPQGASPYGVLDLSGNVWEWCQNEYDRPVETRDEGHEWRVLRGGAWFWTPEFACISSRCRLFRPGYRRGCYGMRVATSSSVPAS
jgi:hypothetical protein